MNALIKLENATRMLAEIRDAKDAKKLMDMASAAETYAKKARLGEEAEAYARTIKIDAQTMLGEFINQTVKSAKADLKNDDATQRHHRTGGTAKALGISKHTQQAARNLAIAKKSAPEIHADVRNGKMSVKKLPQLLRSPAQRKEDGRLQRIKIKTRIYEHLVVMAEALSSFDELDPDKGLYKNDPKRRLTPERMRDAGSNLLRVARLWSEHEKQKGTVTK